MTFLSLNKNQYIFLKKTISINTAVAHFETVFLFRV